MKTIKRHKRNKKEQESDLPVSFKDESKIIENGENSENITAIEEKKGQQYIRTVLIPKETIFIEESRFEKPHFIVQTILMIIAIGTLLGFIYYSAIQHQDSVNALKQAKYSSDSSDVATKMSIALTERSIAIAESSNIYTRQTMQAGEARLEKDIRAYVVFNSVNLEALTTDKPLKVHYSIINTGRTPAKKTFTIHTLGYVTGIYSIPSVFNRHLDSLAIAFEGIVRRNNNGFILGNNIPMNKDFDGDVISTKDLQFFNEGHGIIYLIALTRYYDNFGKIHHTWLCVSFPKDGTVHPEKYNDAD